MKVPLDRSSLVNHRDRRGFTRLEAFAVVLAVLLLGCITVPTLGGYRTSGDIQWCSANFRQLTRGWHLYAEDNAGRLAGNLDGGDAMDLRSTNRTWAAGWIDSNGSPAGTNTALLANSQLGPYVGSTSVYRCPADLSLSRGRTGEPRVRSVAMNSYVGQRMLPWTQGYRLYTSLNQIVDPSPASCLLFVDEREESVNDACFLISMDGYDPQAPARLFLVDFPAARHEGGATMSFVDGHVETWRWADARTRPGLRPTSSLALGVNMPNNPDVQRIQRSTSRRIQSLP